MPAKPSQSLRMAWAYRRAAPLRSARLQSEGTERSDKLMAAPRKREVSSYRIFGPRRVE